MNTLALDGVRPFLDAICDDPDDDAPRLILADWLEERGEVERAEFIRAQCLAASTDDQESRWTAEARAWQIRRRIGEGLVDGPPGSLHVGRFHRGLLHAASNEAPEGWLAPVRMVIGPRPAEADRDWFTRNRPGMVTDLDLTGAHLASVADLVALLDGFETAGVRRIRLPLQSGLCAHVLESAHLVPAWGRIEALTIQEGAIAQVRLRSLVQGLGRAFGSLKELTLRHWEPDPGRSNAHPRDQEPLAEAEWIDQLESLDLGGLPGAWGPLFRARRGTGLHRLAITFGASFRALSDDWRAWSHLESVTIREQRNPPANPDPDAFIKLIAGLASLPRLRSLRMVGAYGPWHLSALARAGGFGALRALRIEGRGLMSVQPLRSARWMGQLNELWITGFREEVPIAGLDAWVADTATANLRRLGLRGIAWSPGEVRHLVESNSLQRLIVLALPGSRLGGEAGKWLAAGGLPRLGMLDVSASAFDRKARVALQRRRGAGLLYRPLSFDPSRRPWWNSPPDGFRDDPRTPWEELA